MDNENVKVDPVPITPVNDSTNNSSIPSEPSDYVVVSGVRMKAESIYPGGAIAFGIFSLSGFIIPSLGLGFAIIGLWWGFKGIKTSKKILAIVGVVLSLVGLVLSLVQLLMHH